MVQLLNFLRALQADSSLLHERVDKDYRRFFYDDFTTGLLKRLCREKSRDDKVTSIFSFTSPPLFCLPLPIVLGSCWQRAACIPDDSRPGAEDRTLQSIVFRQCEGCLWVRQHSAQPELSNFRGQAQTNPQCQLRVEERPQSWWHGGCNLRRNSKMQWVVLGTYLERVGRFAAFGVHPRC